MTEDNKFQISGTVKFPSQLDPFDVKVTKSFGYSVGSSISAEWFHKIGGATCRYYTSQAEYQARRDYANGNVNMQKYHSKLGTNGDVSLLSLPTKPLSRMPKLVDLVVNGICDRRETIEASAIDAISQQNKQKYRQSVQDDMNAKPVLEKAREMGMEIGTMPLDKLPNTDDELNMHMSMEWKPSSELSAQLAIKAVMEENAYDLTIDRQKKRDLVVDGIACEENRFHPSKGIILDRVDATELVYSKTNDPYFRDCFYKGRVKRVLISDVLLEFPELRQQEDLVNMLTEQNSWWNGYHGTNNMLQGHTHLLYFTYRTTREEYSKIKQKASGEKIVSKAAADFDESKLKEGQKNDFKRVSKVEEVLFEGVMVLGTNIMLKWDLAKSMARPNSNTQKVMDQYNIIAPNMQDGKIYSMVSRMMPIEDELNVIELKSCQIIQGITPDGIAIDLDAIAEITIADKAVGPNEMLNMYLQKGSYFYRSYGSGGEFNNAQKPFQEIKTGDSINKLAALRAQADYYLTQLTDVIGLNKATDASTPDRDSLVGIQKLAALNSNLATRHILKGAGYLRLKTSESVLYRVQDIIKYYPSLRKDLIRKIGATAVEDLTYLADLHLSDFALNLFLENDEEENAALDADLSLAMEKGYITLADKYRVKDIKMFKQAIAYLTILIEKNVQKQEVQKAREAQQKSDMDIRTSEQSNLFAQETIKLQMEADRIKQEEVGTWEVKKEKERLKGLMEVEGLKGKNSIELQYLINSGSVQKLETIEANKDKREIKADTRESRKIDQRQKERGPIDFESEEAGLEQFNLDS